MICYKKMMMMCALSTTVFAYGIDTRAKKINSIEKQIKGLQDTKSNLNQSLANKYGDSTMTYRFAHKYSHAEIDAKITQLNKEKANLETGGGLSSL